LRLAFANPEVQAQLAEISSRAPRFPRDGVIVDRYRHDQQWDRFRAAVIDTIDKRRWPAPSAAGGDDAGGGGGVGGGPATATASSGRLASVSRRTVSSLR